VATQTNKRKTNKSSSGKRTSASKKKRSGGKRKSKQLNYFDIQNRSEIIGIASLILGVILFVPAFLKGAEGTIFNSVHNFLFTVFGAFAVIIPAYAVLCPILYWANKNMKSVTIRLAQFAVGVLLIMSLVHIWFYAEQGVSYSKNLSYLYSEGLDGTVAASYFGGLIGGLTGGAVFSLCESKTVASVIVIIPIIILIMVTFRINPRRVTEKSKEPAAKIANAAGEKAKDIGVIVKTTQENAKSRWDTYLRESEENRRRRQEDLSDVDSYSSSVSAATNSYKKTFSVDDFSYSSIVKSIDEDKKSGKISDESKVQNTSGQYQTPQQIALNFLASAGEPESEGKAIPENSRSAEKSVIIPAIKTDDSKFSAGTPFSEAVSSDADTGTDNLPPIIPISDDVPPAVSAQVKPAKKPDAVNNTADKSKDDNVVQALSEGIHEEPVKEYIFPPYSLLTLPEKRSMYYDEAELRRNGEKLIQALSSFNVSAAVSAIVPGPTVTRYELTPAPGVKISKFTGLADDLALCLAAPAGIRIEAPIPNKSAIGIEIPNKDKLTITFREVIETEQFEKAPSKLTVGLGKDISGNPVFCNIAKMPHLLVAGTTGSGKSVLMNSMIVSIVYKAKPEEVRLILIDPKQVEFGMYNGIPHLLVPVVSDARKASGALNWAVTEMLTRYKTFNENRVRDIKGYNLARKSNPDLENIPQIVIFIDELADLMIAAPAEVEDSIQRIAQMGRAAGIHLVVATQRPSVDVITGVIKANMSSRIALTVKSQVDSRTIIDASGAEKLTGHGDMLYAPVDLQKPLRVQGCFLSDEEIADVVDFLKNNGEAEYNPDIEDQIIKSIPQGKKKGADITTEAGATGSIPGISDDEKFADVMEFILANPDQVSISSLQRHLHLGFSRAGRLIDDLIEKGYIESVEGSKTKKVVISKNEWYEILAGSTGGGTVSAEPTTAGNITDAEGSAEFTDYPDEDGWNTDDNGFPGSD